MTIRLGRAVSVNLALAATWIVAHRRSPLVRSWTPSSLPIRTVGPLAVRDSRAPTDPTGEPPLLLLHGLGATGNYFGGLYEPLAITRRLIVPDLLGFGESLDEERADFSLDVHVDSLTEMLDTLAPESDVAIAAHSMSASLALALALRQPERVSQIHLWAPPIFESTDRRSAVGREFGLMTRLLLMDSALARLLCRANCTNRTVSGLIMAMLGPRWPVRVSRDASQHTWPAYTGSLRALVFDVDWTTLAASAAPIKVWCGADDPIGDVSYIAELFGPSNVATVDGVGHHIPIHRPDLLLNEFDPTASTRTNLRVPRGPHLRAAAGSSRQDHPVSPDE